MKHKYDTDSLTKLGGKIKKYKIASYDIETETETGMNNFLIGGYINNNGKYKCFRDKDKMIEYISKTIDKDTMLYATKNSFDFYALFGHTKEYLKEKPIMRGSMLIHAKHNNINTYDTKAYTKASVEQLGEMLGKPKLKINLAKNTIKMSYRRYLELRKYNQRDCEVTREFIIQLQEMLNTLGGTLKCTIGSCAMDLYRRKYLKENIHHEYKKEFRDGTTIKEILELAYHGGRTEMFKRGQEHDKVFNYYDFNSLYPSVMLNKYPKPSSAILTENKKGHLNINSILQFEGVSDCEVLCPYMYFPILSTYYKKKLVFPIGRFRHVFTHIELRKAIENGYKILKIYKTIAYTQTIEPFKEWVTELYAIRKRYKKVENKVYSDLVKLTLNNLYGKFFQSHVSDMEVIHLEDRDDKNLKQNGFTFDYNLGFGYKETPKESNQKFITPIFAVYTTAYARLKIWEKLVELDGVYCDTDSCLTEKIIPTSYELGEMKYEQSCVGLNVFKGKHYSFIDEKTGENVEKIKGLHMSKNKNTRLEQFEKSITGQRIEQEVFLSFKEAIRSGKKPNQIVMKTKKFDAHDDKRVWIKPYDRTLMQDSQPLIIGFKDIEELMKEYNSIIVS